MSLNIHFLAFKCSGSRSELVRAEMLSLSNLPSLEDAKGSGDGGFLSFFCWNFQLGSVLKFLCACLRSKTKMKMQANKSSIRHVSKWMNECSSLQVFPSPMINEFHLLHTTIPSSSWSRQEAALPQRRPNRQRCNGWRDV